MKIYEKIIEDIKKIDTGDLSYDTSRITKTEVAEEQKVYFWIRLYLKEETEDVKPDDTIIIRWEPSGEELKVKFITYSKKGLDRDHEEDEITEYTLEDDKRVLCLMVDSIKINDNNDIPFIRSLFKISKHYDYQLVKRDELLFINKRNGVKLDWYDCGF